MAGGGRGGGGLVSDFGFEVGGDGSEDKDECVFIFYSLFLNLICFII